MSLLSQVIVDHLKYSLSCECCFRASTVPLVECTSTFSEVFTFTEVSVLFQKLFFDMNHNRQGRLPKQKRSMSSKEKKDNIGTRDTVVTSKSSLEMEE